VAYGKVGEKEKLQLIGIVDASYKSDEKSVGGMILMLANEQMTKASPVMWKSKQIERVCHSSKDAETLALSKMLDEYNIFGKTDRDIDVWRLQAEDTGKDIYR
jgi:hypothetical protein